MKFDASCKKYASFYLLSYPLSIPSEDDFSLLTFFIRLVDSSLLFGPNINNNYRKCLYKT